MKRLIFVLVALLSSPAFAQSPETLGDYGVRYFGTASADDAILFTTRDVLRWDRCTLMSTDGSVYVESSLDGVNFSTAQPISLIDLGATSTDFVQSTTADQMYMLFGRSRVIRVRQNGMTAANASLLCYNIANR